MNDIRAASPADRPLERRRRFNWVFAALAVVVIVLIAWVVLHKPAPKPTPAHATPVAVAKVLSQDVPVSVSAIGAAQAWTSDTIFAQVSGKLISVNFTEGGEVKAGQVLAEVDPAPYQAVLMQAQGALKRDQALLTNAKLDQTRYQTLEQQDSVSRQTADTAAALVKQYEGTVLVDQGTVAAARVNLNWCRIVSPISGRAGVRTVDPGNLVSSSGSVSSTPSTASSTSSASATTSTGTGIVVINQIQPIAVTFTVPQGDFQRLSEVSDGFRRPLPTQALSQETGESLGAGELRIADNRVDPATGTVELKARFPNAANRLWPGQFVNVKLTLQTLQHALTMPLGAVNQGPKGAFVYVVGADKKVSARPIKVAETEGAVVVIQSGVQAGETVVVDGQMTLKPGALIRIAPPAAGATAAGPKVS